MDNVCLSCRGDPCLCRCWPCAAKEDEIKRLQRRNAYLEKHVGGDEASRSRATVKGKAQETIEDQAAEIERLRALLLRWRDAARALEADTERALRVVKEVR